ncbi:MAG TPA: GTPase HflX [Terriglobales bacterium]|nr:GTPase HflX [Terriglobales bacterium]
MERAFLVAVELADPGNGRGAAAQQARAAAGGAGRNAEDSAAELRELTESAGAAVVGTLLQRRHRADVATLIGSGKVEEVAAAAAAARADLVIFDRELTPTQQRNLEEGLGRRVVTRTQLILDIFARHARLREGQLQVELAQLEYQLPRLAGHGHAMSRLGGGIGTRGPGETKIETDRRRIRQRIQTVRAAIERVRVQRGQQRQKRESVPLATVALVGYTNAGKSSLFQRLTGAEVLVSARMFATLDPTIRVFPLPSKRRALLSDTVGFLRDLPHGLINAFRATLEEVTRARLLILVSDVAAPDREEREAEVVKVLEELGVGATPRLRVWNKSDLLAGAGPSAAAPRAPLAVEQAPLLVSARTGAGLEELRQRVDQVLRRTLQDEAWEEIRLRVPHPAGRVIHLLHERGEILAEHHAAQRVELVALVPASLKAQLQELRSRPIRKSVENR